MHPPTPSLLKAYAGWAISVNDGVSPAQSLALDRFRQGCAELAEDFPLHKICVPSGAPTRTAVRSSPSGSAFIPVTRENIHALVNRIESGHTCQTAADHKFSIHTQRCLWCNRTYRDVKGRKPEFF